MRHQREMPSRLTVSLLLLPAAAPALPTCRLPGVWDVFVVDLGSVQFTATEAAMVVGVDEVCDSHIEDRVGDGRMMCDE